MTSPKKGDITTALVISISIDANHAGTTHSHVQKHLCTSARAMKGIPPMSCELQTMQILAVVLCETMKDKSNTINSLTND